MAFAFCSFLFFKNIKPTFDFIIVHTTSPQKIKQILYTSQRTFVVYL